MTVTYKTSGKLAYPVNDLAAAVAYLHEQQSDFDMAGYIYPDEAKPDVHSVTWHLTGFDSWEVTLVADCPLGEDQLKLLSEWISGQNSDGLGEGFEQQSFAEHGVWDEDEEDEREFVMSSFDWETNPCTLTEVSGV